jgi:hypothetical protein
VQAQPIIRASEASRVPRPRGFLFCAVRASVENAASSCRDAASANEGEIWVTSLRKPSGQCCPRADRKSGHRKTSNFGIDRNVRCTGSVYLRSPSCPPATKWKDILRRVLAARSTHNSFRLDGRNLGGRPRSRLAKRNRITRPIGATEAR